MSRFVVRMALREIRASWKRLILFFVCVAIGVGAIVGVRSVIQSARTALLSEARALLAADMAIQNRRPWTSELRARVTAGLDRHAVIARTESIETTTMVRPADETKVVVKMVELRGVQREFPFYGTLELTGGQRYSHALLADRGALVRPGLLAQLGVEVGDEILIGTGTFTIRGVILIEPGQRFGAFSFGPRVLIDHDELLRIGLLTFGSRARFQTLVQIAEPGIDPLVDDLREDLADNFLRVWSYHRNEGRMSRNFRRAENYLSLIGFVIVVLGGIGVWSVTRVFIQQKLKSIAILKCLGATSRQVLAIYLLQVLALGLGGSLLGVALATVAVGSVPEDVVVGFSAINYALTPSAVVQGVGIGVLVSLLFSLVPLLDVRHVRPLLLLRG